MRKIFLLLALALCVGANAQTKYSFDMSAMSESDLTITNGSYAGNKITAAAATLAADGETVIPTEMTLQVKDYSRYDMNMFSEEPSLTATLTPLRGKMFFPTYS